MSTSNNKKGLKRADSGGIVTISAETWNTLVDRIEQIEGIFDPKDFIIHQTKTGKNISLKVKPAEAIIQQGVGSFCQVSVSNGSYFLNGGIVTGGSENLSVSPIVIGSVEAKPANGTRVWLSVAYDAQKVDGVLLPGGTVDSVSYGSGSSFPSNTIPTANSPNGTLRVNLGIWQNGAFAPSGCGDFAVSHCPGSLTANRI